MQTESARPQRTATEPVHRSASGRFWLGRTTAVIGLAMLLAGLTFVVRTAPVDAAGPHQVVVRAHGDTGEEQMALRINGNEVARWTVTTSAKAYRYDVESPVEITALEVVFTNDQKDRDLDVDYVNVGGTILQSEANSTVSTGTYVSGEGCIERSSISETLHCSGSFTYNVPDGTLLGRADETGPRIEVRALGTSGGEQLQIRINNSVVLAQTVDTKWGTYATSLPAGTEVSIAEVQFVNDGRNRDLRVDYLEIDGQRFESEDDSTRALGTWSSGSCAERDSSSEWLRCSGWFRYDVGTIEPEAAAPTPQPVETTSTTTTTTAPAPLPDETPTSTKSITVRALGRTGDEVLQLRVNGSAVASWTVTDSWDTYQHSVDATIDEVEVQFVNDGRNRDLRVDYIDADGQRMQAESSSTVATGSYSRSTGCAQRPSTSEWLHCSGSFTFDISGNAAPQQEEPEEEVPEQEVPEQEVPEQEVPEQEVPEPPAPSLNGSTVYFNDFSSATDRDRIDHFVQYRDPWVVAHTTGDSDHAADGPINCSAPEETRSQTRENPHGHIYQCLPGGNAGAGHMMAYAMDTSGYGFVGGLPDQVFDDVQEVSVDVNTTNAGIRNFLEIKILPASQTFVNAMPCGPDFPCNDGWDYDNVNGVGATTVSQNGTGLIINTASRPDGYTFDQNDQTTMANGDIEYGACSTNLGYCRQASVHDTNQGIRDRFTHVFRDNGDGTLSFGIDDGARMRWVTAPGSFPEGPVRVVIAFHNYTGTKSGNGPGFGNNVSPTTGGFTWHWDNLAVTAEAATPSVDFFSGHSADRIVTPDGCIAFSQGQRTVTNNTDVAPQLICDSDGWE